MKTIAMLLLMFTAPSQKYSYVFTHVDAEQAAVTCVPGTVPTVNKLSDSTITVACKGEKK